MIPFKAPTEDILFALSVTGDENHAAEHGFDAEITREILDHFARFAEDVIAPIDEPGDQEGCRNENGRVRMPSGFSDAYQAYVEQGWQAISLAEEFDGQGAPPPSVARSARYWQGPAIPFRWSPDLCRVRPD